MNLSPLPCRSITLQEVEILEKSYLQNIIIIFSPVFSLFIEQMHSYSIIRVWQCQILKRFFTYKSKHQYLPKDIIFLLGVHQKCYRFISFILNNLSGSLGPIYNIFFSPMITYTISYINI